jgi:hypothetical protein
MGSLNLIKMKTKIMFIEHKGQELTGLAKIGRVTFSKTGKTISYGGRQFQSLKGRGFKSNFYDIESGEEYWISGCHKNGEDRLYGERLPIIIDEDVREEYWITIRNAPHLKEIKIRNEGGKNQEIDF